MDAYQLFKHCLVFVLLACGVDRSFSRSEGDSAHNITKPSVTSSVTNNGSSLRVKYTNSHGQVQSYLVEQFDDCSVMGAYIAELYDELAIDGSCAGRAGQVEIRLFKENRSGLLCLHRLVTGEREDKIGGNPLPTLVVERFGGCISPSERIVGNPLSKQASISLVMETYSVFHDKLTSKFRTDMIGKVSVFDAAELAQTLSPENLDFLNNVAFFLQKQGGNQAAAILLNKICNTFEGRIVAKLNLADAYWALGENGLAFQFYQHYQREMEVAGKAALIPSRVRSRLSLSPS